MVDLLPAGVISHGLYGGAKWVQNQPTGQSNSWGVLRPGAPLNFTYQPAMVGAGYIACEGKRVCGATMTSDGFGRWSVPSARDLADVFNMIIASNHSYCQYFDMTVDRIFERVNVLGAEVHRLNLALSRSAGAAETVRPSARENLPVQGQIVEEARQPGGWQPLPPSAALREHSGPCMATGAALLKYSARFAFQMRQIYCLTSSFLLQAKLKRKMDSSFHFISFPLSSNSHY